MQINREEVFNENSTLDLTNSLISNNTANIENMSWEGGAYIDGGTAAISESIVKGNTAKYGGGVYMSPDSGSVLTNVLISGNLANNQGQGSGGYLNGGQLDIINSTIVDNLGSYGIYGSATQL